MEINKIYLGKNEDWLQKIPSNFIDLTLTSPPYDNLRSYNSDFNFPLIAKELLRVTKVGGVVVWNVTDAVINKSKTGTSLRQALYFQEMGFYIHDYMFYEKNSPSYPASEKDNRYSNVIEFVFILSKGIPKTVNLICDKANKFAGIELFGKKGSSQDGKVVKEFSPRSNIWKYVTSQGKETLGHTAVFPESFAADHIKTWSNEGDMVMDIFSGSGTTCKMANLLGRNCLGIEIDEKQCKKSNEKLVKYKNGIFLSKNIILEEDNEFDIEKL